METKVTRRGNRWAFCLEARVAVRYVLEDPETEYWEVAKKMQGMANKVFDEALAKGECRRNSDALAQVVWDRGDPQTAGHPYAEPDPRDDFPGYCPHPDCARENVPGKTTCAEHQKDICPVCGWLRLEGEEFPCKCRPEGVSP